MGNCQAIDAATLVIQYPSGKVDKLYWPVSASEIMKTNPGHYVALLISTTLCPSNPSDHIHVNTNTNTTNTTKLDPNNFIASSNINNNNNNGPVRLTRIKLLRPTDTLVLGQVYRLITTQEVMKGLWAKKQAKLKRNSQTEKPVAAIKGSEMVDKEVHQVIKQERHRPRTATSSATASAATARPRTWQPSLHSISEAAS
ncbi:hypothetical protein TIFTF001_015017 [Ficus carica]|uniref:Uncharacterized protein n=1 Tax=Ficus carica TaxID=3494 RepID=A0AA88A0G9_FICCA|nr:hypothetical protein TIFTF001_015017 [Ficus carica]